MHNPYEEASAYASKDEDKLRKIHEDQIEYEKKAAPVKAAAAASALSIPVGAGIAKTAYNALKAYRWYRTAKRVANTIGTAYDIYDSSKTLFGKDGVSKTFNLFKEGNYLDGAKSLAGDVFLA